MHIPDLVGVKNLLLHFILLKKEVAIAVSILIRSMVIAYIIASFLHGRHIRILNFTTASASNWISEVKRKKQIPMEHAVWR